MPRPRLKDQSRRGGPETPIQNAKELHRIDTSCEFVNYRLYRRRALLGDPSSFLVFFVSFVVDISSPSTNSTTLLGQTYRGPSQSSWNWARYCLRVSRPASRVASSLAITKS